MRNVGKRDNPDEVSKRVAQIPNHHVKGTRAGVNKPIMDRLACISILVIEKLVKMFNTKEKVLVLCQDCHKRIV